MNLKRSWRVIALITYSCASISVHPDISRTVATAQAILFLHSFRNCTFKVLYGSSRRENIVAYVFRIVSYLLYLRYGELSHWVQRVSLQVLAVRQQNRRNYFILAHLDLVVAPQFSKCARMK